jgi:hypothetical protein
LSDVGHHIERCRLTLLISGGNVAPAGCQFVGAKPQHQPVTSTSHVNKSHKSLN